MKTSLEKKFAMKEKLHQIMSFSQTSEETKISLENWLFH